MRKGVWLPIFAFSSKVGRENWGQRRICVASTLASVASAIAGSFLFLVRQKRSRHRRTVDIGDWRDVLARLGKSSRIPVGRSLFMDTFFRHVGDQELLFVKRNEKRFWSRTAAREDAESTLTYLMNQG